MKVLIICGSPRKHGNTVKIISNLQELLIDRGHIAELCNITDYDIRGCTGCNSCQNILDDIGCTQKDETQLLLKKIIDADAVIYGTPLYGHSYSGQLKIFLDRQVALFKFVGGMDKAVDEMQIVSLVENKPALLIVSCMGPKENNTELISAQFKLLCESSLMHSLGTYVFPFSNHDPEQTTIDNRTLAEIIEALERALL